ncbi:hypothetical protein BMQ_pBM40055 (plasmid) [Priestia megaterium QM B1551]|uniref:Uncharacterized protein n=1 Tax=Priestia megaterium (strain ATCC 12872 / QMB1551) TaxID=545693 RepID=D5E3G1_PRIM1|nr:hypothetical protein BMQ_pBM40055 [Priestia megaterium QM B1551]
MLCVDYITITSSIFIHLKRKKEHKKPVLIYRNKNCYNRKTNNKRFYLNLHIDYSSTLG